MMATHQLPNPTRYITENDAEGNSIFSPSLAAPVEVRSQLGGGLRRLAYQANHSLMTLSDNSDLEHYKDRVPDPSPTHPAQRRGQRVVQLHPTATQQAARCTGP